MDAPKYESGSVHPPLLQQHWRWRLLGVCASGTLLFGVIGFLEYQHGQPGAASLSNAFYQSFQLFALHSPHFDRPIPWTLDLARWLGAASTFLAVFEFAHHAWRQELTTLRLGRLSGHVIVCGLGRKGLSAARRLREQQCAVIVVEKSPQPDMLAACRELGVHVLPGDATNAEALQGARIGQAQTLIALCPDDSTNCEIAAQARSARQKLKSTAEPLRCEVHLSDPDLRAQLQGSLSQSAGPDGTVLRFFDAYDSEARQLLIHELPLDHDGIARDETRQTHLVIVGFGRMGRALAVRAAQLGQFANDKRLRISVIDRNAARNRDELLFRYPRFAEVCDVEFHGLEAVSPQARELLENWSMDRARLTSIATCFDNEQRGLEIAMQLLPVVKAAGVRLAVRMARQTGLAHLMSEQGNSAGGLPSFAALKGSIRPFGMEERCCRQDDPNEKFAQDIHRAYVEKRKADTGENAAKLEALKTDPATRAWEALPEDLRESNRQQADHMFIKLRAIGCEVAPLEDARPAVTEISSSEMELLSELEHRRWMAERKIANWTFAIKKNIERRENPNLVEWEKLSEGTKDYDRETIQIIPNLLKGAGKKICRRLTSNDLTGESNPGQGGQE